MKAIKIIAVVFGAVFITSLAIDAADTLSGQNSTLLAQLMGFESGDSCPSGMISVAAGVTFSCVDEYEVSPKNCNVNEPANKFDTEINLANRSCVTESSKDNLPWSYVNREQAAVLCARSGKRLPTADEWYRFSLGTEANFCNIDSKNVIRGVENDQCVSAYGIKNTVGNVWEWVSDDVISGNYKDRKLPPSGYVVQVDSGGVATISAAEKDGDKTKSDYFWSEAEGAYGMIRGGFYGSKSDAGVFTLHAGTEPNFAGAAVGFRCVL